MASKNAGRLAGLAALAGAAYLANEKFKDKDKDKAKSETKDTSASPVKDMAAENNRIADARAAREDEKSTALSTSDEGERPAPYSNEHRMQNRFADRPKARSASVAKTPAPSAPDSRAPSSNEGRTPGTLFNPRPDPRDAEGATRGMRSDSKAAEDAKQAGLMSAYKPRRPDVKLRDTRFTVDDTPKRALYSNAALRQSGSEERTESDEEMGVAGRKRGGMVKKMASGGSVSSASRRADGIATKGKTRGKMV